MESERNGPDVVRHLEPPGFFALNYGSRTPIVLLGAHVLFGLQIGWGYDVGV